MAFMKPKRLSEGFTDFSNISTVRSVGSESKAQIVERLSQKPDMSKIKVRHAKPKLNPFDHNFRKRVAVYCRVSTDKISQTPSLVTQRNYYINYVRMRKDMHMQALYWDKGISATSLQRRAGLVRLLRDAQKGYFDVIIVKNLSRLSRNLMDCMRIIYFLRELPHPVGIIFEEEKLFTLDSRADFMLQMLAILAQEESHKKSEAITWSIRKRYELGLFMKFDVLGYRRETTNKLKINPEEAPTLQLIFTMYLAGCNPTMIAEVLNMLKLKKHSHEYVDGKRFREGKVDWTKSSVINVLKNEKCCGDVEAQKTVTPSFLDHKSVPNTGQAPSYHAVNQHDAVVDPADYYLAQRLMFANRRGWKHGIQEMKIYDSGCLLGGVSTVPNWYGFTAEDYNRACLRAYGTEEQRLQEIEKQIMKDNEEFEENDKEENSIVDTDTDNKVCDFPEMLAVDSDDYESFPEENVSETTEDTHPSESFAKHVKTLREELKKTRIENAPNIETCRAEFFPLTEKVCITFDHLGSTFNKFSFNRLNEGSDSVITDVEMIYNPVEQALIVRKAQGSTPKTVNWVKGKNNKYDMKRCCTKGLSSSIYQNMKWNPSYKYRIVGRAFEYSGETMLIFFLDSFTEIVPAKVFKQEEKKEATQRKRKRKFEDGALDDDIVLPELEDIKFEEGTDITERRSSVIYFYGNTLKDERELTLKDLGKDKYSAERISHMLKNGLKPAEGWEYLKGMAVMGKNRLTIFPESWADSFGDNASNNRDERLKAYLKRAGPSGAAESSESVGSMGKGKPYGWTVGLMLPTMDTVNEMIAELKSSA